MPLGSCYRYQSLASGSTSRPLVVDRLIMLVKPIASYGCLTCGFRCFSSQMIQLHWRHWHHAFVAPAPSSRQGLLVRQVQPSPEVIVVGDRSSSSEVSSRSESRQQPTTPTIYSAVQSKHLNRMGATFKDKSVGETTTAPSGKHWAVS